MTWLTSRARNNNRRLSVISSASTTPSAQDDGPWCDKCTSLNRQLHGYLLEILKHGEDAIGEWAYAVGASPDHMECEPAPERIIPEGFRRCSRQHQLCAAGTASEPRTVMPPPLVSEWSRTVFPSGAYSEQPESTSGQASTVTSPYSQLPSTLDLVQRTQEPVPVPSAANLRTCHTLVAIPYTQGPAAPSQTQLPAPQPVQPPWNGGFQRPVAMYPNSGPAQNTTYPWASQHTQMTLGPQEQGGQQDLRTANNLPGSLACNEAMRNVGQGRVLKGEQDVLGSEIPG